MKRSNVSTALTLILMGGLSLIAGCAVRMNQLDTAKRLIPQMGATRELAEYAWVLSFNGVELTVYPVEAKGRNVLFANGNGLRLTWDGETVIVIDGLPGALGRYESGVEGAERWYARAGAPVVRLSCTPPRQWRLTDDRKGWRQECSGLVVGRRTKTEHLVELDGRGNIRLIETTLIPGVSPLRLRRANP
jgi:hypothetical protein